MKNNFTRSLVSVFSFFGKLVLLVVVSYGMLFPSHMVFAIAEEISDIVTSEQESTSEVETIPGEPDEPPVNEGVPDFLEDPGDGEFVDNEPPEPDGMDQNSDTQDDPEPDGSFVHMDESDDEDTDGVGLVNQEEGDDTDPGETDIDPGTSTDDSDIDDSEVSDDQDVSKETDGVTSDNTDSDGSDGDADSEGNVVDAGEGDADGTTNGSIVGGDSSEADGDGNVDDHDTSGSDTTEDSGEPDTSDHEQSDSDADEDESGTAAGGGASDTGGASEEPDSVEPQEVKDDSIEDVELDSDETEINESVVVEDPEEESEDLGLISDEKILEGEIVGALLEEDEVVNGELVVTIADVEVEGKEDGDTLELEEALSILTLVTTEVQEVVVANESPEETATQEVTQESEVGEQEESVIESIGDVLESVVEPVIEPVTNIIEVINNDEPTIADYEHIDEPQEKVEEFVDDLIDGSEKKQEETFSEFFEVTLTLPDGSPLILDPSDYHFEVGSVNFILERKREFKPGRYQVDITFTNPITGEQEVISQNFSWGVIAMNTVFDRYQSGETGVVEITVLDDDGMPVCDAVNSLEVKTPNGDTEAIEVIDNDTCTILRTGFSEPDYFAEYVFEDEGEYTFNLVAETDRGPREYAISRTVGDIENIRVERDGPTRVYPRGATEMTMRVYFEKDFSGDIVEIVPGSFEISGATASLSNEDDLRKSTEVGSGEEEVGAGNEERDNSDEDLATGGDNSENVEGVVTESESSQVQDDLLESETTVGKISYWFNRVLSPLSRAHAEEGVSTYTEDDLQYIVYKGVVAEEGDVIELSYYFVAPPVSPDFFLTGPLVLEHSDEITETWYEAYPRELANDEPTVNSSSLKLHWKMNEGSGTSVADTSTNGSTGTLQGASSWISSDATPDDENEYAVYLSGSTDYISGPSMSASEQGTYAIWVKPDGLDYVTEQYAMASSNSSGSYPTIHNAIGLVHTNQCSGEWFTVISNGSSNEFICSGETFDSSNFSSLLWTHLAVSYDGSEVKFYRNGELVSTVSQTITGQDNYTSRLFSVGKNGESSTGYFEGAVDDVRIYDRVLTQAEIGIMSTRPIPAGVSSGLNLWLDASNGLTDGVGSNDMVWTDISGLGHNMDTTAGVVNGTEPDLVSGAINGHPVVEFNNGVTTDYLGYANYNDHPTSTMTQFIVVDRDPTTRGEGLYSYTTTPVNDNDGLLLDLSNLRFYFGQGAPVTTGNLLDTGYPELIVYDFTPGALNVYQNENANGGNTYSNDANAIVTGGTLMFGQEQDDVGGDFSASQAFQGSIAEVITYDTILSEADRRKVASYLAFKYSSVLGSPSNPIDYVDGSDTTIWDSSLFGSSFQNGIFGIGWDQYSGLEQTESQPEEGYAEFLVLDDPSDLNEGEYLFLGNNNPSTMVEDTVDVPGGIKYRLDREWLVQETGDVGTVDIEIDLSTVSLTNGAPVAGDFTLLIDTDSDQDFATGAIERIAASSYSSDVVTFEDVDLTSGSRIAIGTANVINGFIYKPNGDTVIGNGPTVHLLRNGATHATTPALGDGSFEFTSVGTFAVGDVVTLYLDTNGGDVGAAVGVYGGGGMQLDIIENRLVTYTPDSGTTVDITHLDLGHNGDSDLIAVYTDPAGGSTLSITGDFGVDADSVYDISGTDFTVLGDFELEGTLRLQGTETVTLANGPDIDSGTFEFTGDGGTGTIDLSSFDFSTDNTTPDFYNVTFGTSATDPAQTFQLGGNTFVVAEDWTLAGGSMSSNNVPIVVHGLNTCSLTTNGGSFSQLAATVSCAGNLEVSSNAVWTGGTGTITVGGDLLIYDQDLVTNGAQYPEFTSTSSTMTVTGNIDIRFGKFTHNSGTVVLDGATQIVRGGTFNNLTKTGTGTLIVPAMKTITVEGLLTLTGTDSSNRLTINSDINFLQGYISSTGTSSLQYLNVKNNVLMSSTFPYSPVGSVDSGNTIGWFPSHASVTTLASTIEIDGNDITELSTSDQMGDGLTNIGDLDLDGVPDLAVGAWQYDTSGSNNRGGIVIMFMNSDGTLKSHVLLSESTTNMPSQSNTDRLGRGIVGVGDMNYDGIQDIIVGAPFHDGAQNDHGGTVTIYLDTDGSVKSDSNSSIQGIDIEGSNDQKSGTSMAYIGDRASNFQGGATFAVGVPEYAGATDVGAVTFEAYERNNSEIFMYNSAVPGISGTIEAGTGNGPDSTAATLTNQDNYGISLDSAGDFNKDGIMDIIVGSPGDDATGGQQGAAFIHTLNSGSAVAPTATYLLNATTMGVTLGNDYQLGTGVEALRDWDGDGVLDYVMGAIENDTNNNGAIYMAMMNADGSVKSTTMINKDVTNAPAILDQDQWGYEIAYIPDADGDGIPQLAVSALGDDAAQSGTGAIHMLTFGGVGTYDYGDAPDTGAGTGAGNYNTLESDSGARHLMSALYLGACVDSEVGTLQGAGTADDLATGASVQGTCTGNDDEDGVTFQASLSESSTSTVDIVSSLDGNVDMWIDFNQDGDWLDAGEQVLTEYAVTAPSDTGVNITIPAGITAGTSYARVRLSNSAGLTPTGDGGIGEVEDYAVTLAAGSCPAPGCVLNNLQMWLRADDLDGDGAFGDNPAEGTAVSQWDDSWNTNKDGTQGTGANQPTYRKDTELINFNEAIEFDGAATYLTLPDSTVPEANENYSVFIVGTTNDVASNSYMLAGGNVIANQFSAFSINASELPKDGWFLNDVSAATAMTPAVPNLFSSVYDNTSGRTVYFDGKQEGSGANVNHSGGSSNGRVGNFYNTISATETGFWNGKISEIIVYDQAMTAVDRQKVESYLAIKYGLTQDTTDNDGTIEEGDYVSTAGTVVWDTSVDSTYHNDVAGIGQDDDSALDQTQSKSQNLDGVVTISAASSQETGDFLLWGNDGTDGVTWVTTGAPSNYARIARTWLAKETNDIGTVTVTLDAGDTDMDITAPNGSIYILYDADNDGSLTDETPVVMTNTSGDIWEKTGLDLVTTGAQADGKVEFTFAVENNVLVEFSSATGTSTDEDGNPNGTADNLPTILVNGSLNVASTISLDDLGTGNATGGGTDFTFTDPSSIGVPAGAYDGTTATDIVITALTLPTPSDGDVEGNETIDLQLNTPGTGVTVGDANGNTATISDATYTITDDDVAATIAGGIFTDQTQGTPGANGRTVRLLVNGASAQTTTTSNNAAGNGNNGEYSFTVAGLSAADRITVHLDDGTSYGVSVVSYSAGNLSDFNIYEGYLVVRTEDGTPLTNTLLDNANDGDPDLVQVYSDATTTTLTINNGAELFVWPGDEFAPTGVVDASGNVDIGAGSTYTGGATAVSIAGGFNNDGTWTHTGALDMNGTAAQTFDQGSSTIGSDVTISNSSAAVTVDTNAFDIGANDLVIGAGAVLDINGLDFTANGTSNTNDGTFRLQGKETISLGNQDTNSGTWHYKGDDTGVVITVKDFGGGTDYYNLLIDDTSAAATDSFQATSALTIAGSLTVSDSATVSETFDLTGQTTDIEGSVTIGAEGTLTAGAAAIYVATDWTNNGTFNADSSTVTLDGAGNDHTIVGTTTFNNLTMVEDDDADDGVLTLPAGVTTTVSGTLTLDGVDSTDQINIVSSTPTTASILKVTGSYGTTDFLDISDNILQDASGTKSPERNPDNSTDTTNTLGWFPSTGPGGISSSLNLWLKANVGTSSTTDAAALSQWDDQSGRDNNATQGTGANQPLFQHATTNTNAINSNPTIDFDGSAHRFDLPDNTVPEANESYTVFGVGLTDTAATGSLLAGGTEAANQMSVFGVTGAGPTLNDEWHTNTATAGTSVTTTTPFMGSFRYDNASGRTIFLNGKSDGTVASTAHAGGTSNGQVGYRSSTTNEYWNGRIAEMIVYDQAMTAVDRQKVESYLAIKYGLTLDTTDNDGTIEEGDYVNAAGTVIWDTSVDSAYHNDVAGLLQDDTSVLDQTTSKSSNLDSVVTISAASSQDNNDALVWGNNNASGTAWTVTGAPTGYARLAREWRAKETNDIGTVTVTVDAGNTNMDIPAANGSLYILYDSNNDGSLTDETPAVMTNTSGDIWEKTALSLTTSNDVIEFTFAVLNSVTVEFSAASAASSDEDGLATAPDNFATMFVNGTLNVADTIDLDDLGTGSATGGGSDFTFTDPTGVALATGVYDGTTATDIVLSGSVALPGDSTLEPNETIDFQLNNPGTASVATGDANGDTTTQTTFTYTITEDDAAAVTIANESQAEDGGAITFTATLDNAVAGGFTVNVSTADGTATTADSDYGAVTNQTLTFAGTAAETQTFTVTPTADTKVEADETITISMSTLAATSAAVDITDTATGTFTNDDSAVLTIADVNGLENAGAITATVTLDNAVDGGFTIDVNTVDGTATTANSDYTAVTSQTLTFAGTAGETQTFDVTPTADAILETNETITLSMNNLASTALGASITNTDTATLTITNDEADANVTIADVVANEDGGAATLTATLDIAVQGGFSVDVNTADNTATTGDSDYTAVTSQTLTFAGTAGETETFTVTPTADAKFELDETVTVSMNNLSIGSPTVNITDTATLTINNDEAPNATVSVTAHGNETGPADITYLVALDIQNDTGAAITFDGVYSGTATGNAAVATDDYRNNESGVNYVSIPTGQSSVTITAAVNDDGITELTETAIYTISNVSNSDVTIATASATANISDNDSPGITIDTAGSTGSALAGTEGTTDDVEISINTIPTSGNVVVACSDTSGQFTVAPASMAFSNTTSQTLTITMIDDAVVEGTHTDTITCTVTANNGSTEYVVSTTNSTDTVTITDNDTTALTIADVAGNEDAGAQTFSVTLGNAVSGGFTVDVSTTDGTAMTADSDYTAVTSQTLTFAGTAGEIETFTVTPTADTKLEANETFTVGMSNIASTTLAGSMTITDTATGTINDDDTAAVTIADVSGAEDGGVITLTATLDNAVQGGFTFEVDSSDGSATTANSDYTAVVDQLITFTGTAGETQTFNLTPTTDAILETDETVTFAMNTLGATALAVDITDGATATITNDEGAATVTIADASAAENGGAITVSATLDIAVQGGFSVDVSTADGSATTADSDYTAVTSQTLTFAGTVGEVETFTVTPTADTDIELDENVTVSMGNLAGTSSSVTITDTATVTFTNDDSANADLLVSTNGLEAGPVNIVYQVALTAANKTGSAITFDTAYTGTATAGSDFTDNSGATTISVANGASTGTLTTTVTDDSLLETTTETAILTISNVSDPGNVTITTAAASATITDNDTTTATLSLQTGGAEAGGPTSAVILVTLGTANNTGSAITFDASFTGGSATGGSDYNNTVGGVGAISVADGATTQTFTIPVIDDGLSEGVETIQVTINNPSNPDVTMVASVVTATIADDEAAPDTDGDGVDDSVDTDDDGDGILDTDEGSALIDSDSDGIVDSLDLDSDNDGVPDIIEAGGVDTNNDGRVDSNTDTDGDGYADTFDTDNGGTALANPDTDGDGLKDFRDLDTDNDGIQDILEAGGVDADANGRVDTFIDTDGDGWENTFDSDNGGTALPYADTDGDGVVDRKDLDNDNDGINNIIEAGGVDTTGNGMVDVTTDTDGDGWADTFDSDNGGTVLTFPNTDGDGVPNYLDLDSDNDSISDHIEGGSKGIDSNNDGVIDGTDADGDGIIDTADGNTSAFGDSGDVGPLDFDSDGTPDYIDIDSDSVAPVATDHDIDEHNGGANSGLDANADGMIDTVVDSDNDGIADSIDTAIGTFGGIAFTDKDNVDTSVENAAPNSGDGNGDGFLDSSQTNVTSTPDNDSSNYLTFEITDPISSTCPDVVTFNATDEVSLSDDPSYEYPYGLNIFQIDCVAPGQTVNVAVYYHGANASEITATNYRKYGIVPGTNTIDWYTLNDYTPVTVTTETVGSGTAVKVAFALTDDTGAMDGLGDDNTTGGIIVDANGPGVTPSTSISTSVGGRNGGNRSTSIEVTIDDVVSLGTSPAISGTVDTKRAKIRVVVDGVTYVANVRDGVWSLPAGTIADLGPGGHVVNIEATKGSRYGDVIGTITIIAVPETCPAFFSKRHSFGDNGGDILPMQILFNRYLETSIKEDGLFRNETLQSLKRFQTLRSIEADGIVGPQTRGELNRVACELGIHAILEVTKDIIVPLEFDLETYLANLDIDLAEYEAVAELVTGETSSPETSCKNEGLFFTERHARGDNGGELYALQVVLNKYLGTQIREDGLFRGETDEALRNFQRDRSIKIDGIVGPLTRGELNKVVCEFDLYGALEPVRERIIEFGLDAPAYLASLQ